MLVESIFVHLIRSETRDERNTLTVRVAKEAMVIVACVRPATELARVPARQSVCVRCARAQSRVSAVAEVVRAVGRQRGLA